ncbi:MAG TPA: NAD(P)-dependent oxidoreductase [Pseudonocardiaceae bacterium]|jgi:D-3-phosphoglycerate dehydrogenase
MSRRLALLSRIVGSDRAAMAHLTDAGVEVVIDLPGFQALDGDEQRWREVLGRIDGLVLGLQPLTRTHLDAAPDLRYVLRIGTGTDNIDVAEAHSRGIVVESLAGLNAPAVAEYAFALLLAAAKHIPEADRSLRSGEWTRFYGRHLGGRTLGLVGFGEIARAMVPKARGFGMDVIAHRRSAGTQDSDGVSMVSLDELLTSSDFISVHVPLTDATRGMIGARELALVKPGTVLVNTARGAVVDEQALYDALVDGRIGAAALDVFSVEPPGPMPLFDLPNVVVSPHNGGYSDLVTELTARSAAERIVAGLAPLPAQHKEN